MKLFRIVAMGLATAAALLSGNAFAQANPQFKVNLTLTPKCYINMTATPGHGTVSDVSLTYTAFQTTDEEQSTSFAVKCTNTLAYDVAVSPATGTVSGVAYALKLVESSTASYSDTGDASLTALVGSSTGKDYSIGVRAKKDQAGTCAAPPCSGFSTHTVTVTY
jgi:hypothetical protein